VIVVLAGRGGSGRTTLAVEVGAALARPAGEANWRVLLVDSDPVAPDLDLVVGAADPGVDRSPNARLDQLLLRLPELAEKRVHLDELLWADPGSTVRALLAPERAGEIGREQLDYLYTYMLAPEFDAIIVDGGPLQDPLAGPAGFWLGLADAILIPLRVSTSHARSAVRTVGLLEELGIAGDRCCLVMGVDRSEASRAAQLQRSLDRFLLARWPWSAEAATRATETHRPRVETEPALAQALRALIWSVTAPRAGET
jgi:cellulose biosynthesis protein BcsQ